MKPEEIKKVLDEHAKWRRGEGGARADLSRASLRWADLRGADLRGANLPSPTMVLLASWGEVSDDLCRDLMRYDAACHDDPGAFDRWKADGLCPYNCRKFQRAANFNERWELYSPGPAERPWDLMVRVIREKCADSDYHDKEGVI